MAEGEGEPCKKNIKIIPNAESIRADLHRTQILFKDRSFCISSKLKHIQERYQLILKKAVKSGTATSKSSLVKDIKAEKLIDLNKLGNFMKDGDSNLQPYM